VKKADGKDLDANADLSTVNLFLHSLFDQIEVYIGSTLVSSKPYYNYIAYLLTHLSYSSDYKRDILKNALYIEDTNAGSITLAKAQSTSGYVLRQAYISTSKALELIGPLYDDVLFQDRAILPNIPIRIKLKRASTKFSLLSASDSSEYSIEFEEAIYYVRRLIVSPTISNLHMRQISTHKALYPFTSNQIKTLSIPQNSLNAVFENIFPSSRLPQVLLVGFVESEAFNGRYSKNPYNFKSFGISNISLSVDQVSYEYRNLNLNFDKIYLLAFQTLLTGLNLENRSVGINRDNYLDGNVLFAFQLMGYDGASSLENRVGNVKMEVTFSTALSSQIIGICLAQNKAIMTIDKNGIVELENVGIL